jgi:hypothetical protein
MGAPNARALVVVRVVLGDAPAFGERLGQSGTVACSIGRVVRVLPRLGATSCAHDATAAVGGPCLAIGAPNTRALVVVRVVLSDTPAFGGRLGRSGPIASTIGQVVWVLPRLGLTGCAYGTAAALSSPCLATVLPTTCALVVVRVVLRNDFRLNVIRVVLGNRFCGLGVTLALGSGEWIGVEEEGGLFASHLLGGARCPARELQLANPAIELD